MEYCDDFLQSTYFVYVHECLYATLCTMPEHIAYTHKHAHAGMQVCTHIITEKLFY